ncbi:MAG: M55 family metallopeptidase, partial [Acidobacteriota bacterium]
EQALRRLNDFEPFVVETPIRLDLSLTRHRPAELLAYLPSVVRTGSHSVRFTGRDMVEISRFMEFASAALSGLAR